MEFELPNYSDVAEIHQLAAEAGRLWAKSPYRPRPSERALQGWHEVLNDWAASEHLPLLIRSKKNCGEHRVAWGRTLFIADNTPAHWALRMALNGRWPKLDRWRCPQDVAAEIPLQLTTKGSNACLLKGWSVRHIRGVSNKKRRRYYGSAGAAEALEDITEEFKRFLSPRNMLLIPAYLGAFGELSSFIDAVVEHDDAHAESR